MLRLQKIALKPMLCLKAALLLKISKDFTGQFRIKTATVYTCSKSTPCLAKTDYKL